MGICFDVDRKKANSLWTTLALISFLNSPLKKVTKNIESLLLSVYTAADED